MHDLYRLLAHCMRFKTCSLKMMSLPSSLTQWINIHQTAYQQHLCLYMTSLSHTLLDSGLGNSAGDTKDPFALRHNISQAHPMQPDACQHQLLSCTCVNLSSMLAVYRHSCALWCYLNQACNIQQYRSACRELVSSCCHAAFSQWSTCCLH